VRFQNYLCIAIVISGCGPSDPDPFYTGEFVVRSEYPQEIRINEWSNFGVAQPGDGNIVSGADAFTFFPKLSGHPDKSTVRWVVDGEEELHSQEIDLQGLAPPNVEGTLEFLFDAEGVWHARFVPKSLSNSSP